MYFTPTSQGDTIRSERGKQPGIRGYRRGYHKGGIIMKFKKIIATLEAALEEYYESFAR